MYNAKCNNNNHEYSFNNTAFSGNSQIESITFDYGITTIGFLGFNSMTSLKKISFPNSLKKIENGAFSYCSLKKYSCISYPSSIIDILKPHFSQISLGLGNKYCIKRFGFNSIISIMIFIL